VFGQLRFGQAIASSISSRPAASANCQADCLTSVSQELDERYLLVGKLVKMPGIPIPGHGEMFRVAVSLRSFT
jgi:hypothetical protein